MTDPAIFFKKIKGIVSAKALSAKVLKNAVDHLNKGGGNDDELRKCRNVTENRRRMHVESAAPVAREMSDEVQLSDETVGELSRAGFDEERSLRSNKRLQMEIIHWIQRELQKALRRSKSYCSLWECSRHNY